MVSSEAGRGEITFQDHVGLEITVVSGASPLREAGWGPSELLPSPLSLPPSHRGLGHQPTALPLTAPHHCLPLSFLESFRPAPDTLLAGPVVVGHATWDLFSSRDGWEEAGGQRRLWELGAGSGSLLAKAPSRPFLIFSPTPRVTSNHVFLLHALPTRQGSETSHCPPPPAPHTQTHLLRHHRAGWGARLGEREDPGPGEKGRGQWAGQKVQANPSGQWEHSTGAPGFPPPLKQGLRLAAL